MDIRAEARRLAGVATIFVWVGWFFVLYAILAGTFWWIGLASKPSINFLEALGRVARRDRRARSSWP